jgi:hypothetical protein
MRPPASQNGTALPITASEVEELSLRQLNLPFQCIYLSLSVKGKSTESPAVLGGSAETVLDIRIFFSFNLSRLRPGVKAGAQRVVITPG